MRLSILCFIILFSFSCGLKDSIEKRITIFEKNESKHFENILLIPIRNQYKQKPLEFEVFRRNVKGKAIVQVDPKIIVHRNFPQIKDSISFDLLKIVKSMKIRALYNKEEKTQIEFYYEKKYIILIRGLSYDGKEQFRTSDIKSFDGEWKYFIINKNSD